MTKHRGLTDFITSLSSAIWFGQDSSSSIGPSTVLSSATLDLLPAAGSAACPHLPSAASDTADPAATRSSSGGSAGSDGASHMEDQNVRESDALFAHSTPSQQRTPSFADIPSVTVPEGASSWQHFHNSAFSARVHQRCFLVQGYSQQTQTLIAGQYELVVLAASGWRCRCTRFGSTGNCFHARSATQLADDPKYAAAFDEDKTVIPCNGSSSLWAVLGGAGTNRSVVSRQDGQVRQRQLT